MNLKPHVPRPIPRRRRLSLGYFGQIVLGGSGVVDLLSGDVVDGSARRDVRDLGGGLRGVAAEIRARYVLDALLGVGVLGHPGYGPVGFFGLAVDDEPWEGI